MSALVQVRPIAPGWVRDRDFDLTFIVAVAAVALVSGAIVVAEPRWFGFVLVVDLWLLGYHHVAATWTRLCFDRQSFALHRFLVLWLPPLVLVGAACVAVAFGFWALTSLYLYWQWFHYTRQSWGVSRIYRRKAGDLISEDDRLEKLAFSLLPIWGILHRSNQAPERFLGAELRVIPVGDTLVALVGAAALVAGGVWLAQRLRAWWKGRLPLAHTLYMLSHFAIFYTGYIAIQNLNHGWLVINVWHNAQYILFVWLFNARRFSDGEDPKARTLSRLSQPANVAWYFAACFGLSTLVYLSIGSVVASLTWALVIYQAINFHHYIVDGLIWKVRRPALQRTLGLAREGAS